MKRSNYSVIAASGNPFYNPDDAPSADATVYKFTGSSTTDELPTGALEACRSIQRVFTLDPVNNFLNWDMLMSQVVKANTDGPAVSITEGFSFESATLSKMDQFLSTTFSISYTETWYSSFAALYTFTVPTGKYGAVVSNLQATRYSGYVNIRC
jgi:hypothetical protein